MAFLAVFLELGVLPIDLEVGDVMLERSPLREIGGRVTLGTGHIEELIVELLLMHTGVAGHAEIAIRIREFKDFLAIPHMTLLAVRRLMLTRQREARLIMEGAIRLNLALEAHRFPAFGRMALIAAHALELLMERGRVWRNMAGRAAFLRQIRESVATQITILAQHLMPLLTFKGLRHGGRTVTFKTLVFLVLAGHREDRVRIVIKAQGILPLDIVVAGFTVPQGSLLGTHFLAITMIIRMAGIAVFLQPSPLKGSGSLGQHSRCLLMTVLARDAIVLAAQRKACHAMVEFLLRLQGKTPQSTQKNEDP